MLERATACLQSGAVRDSLKCVQRVPRSKRKLHSMFWSHGASDLDLAPKPWFMSTTHSDPPLAAGSRSHELRRSRKSKETEFLQQYNPTSDGVFLDFLYPPQALAWLHRVHGLQIQRWERRNARRLPEGFVVASREFSCRSQWRAALAQVTEPRVQQPTNYEDEQVKGALAGSRGQTGGSSSSEAQEPRTGDAQESREQTHLTEESSGGQRFSDQFDFSSKTADSAAELAESASQFVPSQPPTVALGGQGGVRELRSVMARSRAGLAKNRVELMQNAIQIYESLDDASKDDARLKRELLEWLSLQDSQTAQLRCIELYKKLPKSERTLPTYQAALSAMLAQGHDESTSSLHEEALQNIENGHVISRELFRAALDNRHWDTAIRVERQHHARYAHTSESSQIRVFWLHVSETPQLLLKAISLVKHLQLTKRSTELDDHTRKFYARFFKEAFHQEFIRKDSIPSFSDQSSNTKLPLRHIRRLMAHISQVENDAAKLYEDILMAILHPKSGFSYAQLHYLASSVYLRFIKISTTPPSEQLLMLWLERVTQHAETVVLGRSDRGISPPVLVREWFRHYGQVSKEGVERLLAFNAKLGQMKNFEKWLAYFRSTYATYEDEKDILWTTIWIHARRADLDQAQHAFAEVSRITSEHGEQPDIKCWNMLLLAHSRADDLEGALTNLRNLVDQGGLRPDKRSIHNVLQLYAKRGDVEGLENLLKQYNTLSNEKHDVFHLGSLLTAHINNNDIRAAEVILRDCIPKVRSRSLPGSLTGCFNIILTAYALRRDLPGTVRTHQWMKDERIRLNGNSYGALFSALVNRRRTQEAWGLMKRVMPKKNINVTAFHYAIIIAGFVNNQQPHFAIKVYEEMRQKGVRPTISTNIPYLKAKAIVESQQMGRTAESNGEPIPLEETIAALKRFLRRDSSLLVSSVHPSHGVGDYIADGENAAIAAYFDFLISIHGNNQCLKAVHELNRRYREQMGKRGSSHEGPPIKLLASLAAAHWRAREHEGVEECWNLAKEQADRVTQLLPLPKFAASRTASIDSDALALGPAISEASRMSGEPKGSDEVDTLSSGDTSQVRPDFWASSSRTAVLDEQEPRFSQPAPARRHVLSRVLRFYLLSLHAQNRTLDAIATISQILHEGYTIDNMTWNAFIRTLCRRSPPMALLAFVLTERFLTPNFSGWSQRLLYKPRPEAVAYGLQYMNASYLAPGRLTPRYDTLVWLAGALLAIRQSEASGRKNVERNLSPELKKYIGTFGEIQRQAPNTLSIVQNMPKIADRLQARVLGYGGF